MIKSVNLDLPEVKLSYKQKLILGVLRDEFHGEAYGPQLLKESENKDLKQLSINEITWHILRLRDAGLLNSEKKVYDGRTLNLYKISDYIKYDVIIIK